MTKEEKFFEDLSVIGNPKSRISEGLIEKTVDDISVMVNSFSFNPRKYALDKTALASVFTKEI